MKTFYSAVGWIYFAAFLSLYLQSPGLVGSDGVLPVDALVNSARQQMLRGIYSPKDALRKVFSETLSLVLVAPDLSVPAEALLEAVFVVGMACSVLIGTGCHNRLLFLLAFFCFKSVRDVGGVFTSFQWDILLLEVGFLCVLASSFFSTRVPSNSLFLWCFRFVAFKLMLQAGVVKLQALCPTWESLSALEYHFATQPLPTPLAWFAHQLPPIVLRLSVAATLLIEIPLTILLVCPLTLLRRIGVVLQVTLQVAIMLTGNYNYFNLLTCCLMVPVWLEDYWHYNSSITARDIQDGDCNCTPATALSVARHLDSHRYSKAVQLVSFALLVLLSVAHTMQFSLGRGGGKAYSLEWWRGEHIQWTMRWPRLRPQLYYFLFAAILLTAASLMLHWLLRLTRLLCSVGSRPRSIQRVAEVSVHMLHDLAQGIAIAVVFLLNISTMSSISSIYTDIHSAIAHGPSRIVLDVAERPLVARLCSVSSYGLFRTMTGRGRATDADLQRIRSRFGSNFEPSVVSRPELVMEGRHALSGEWIEIPFM